MPVPPDFLHAVGANALPVLAAVEVGSSILGKVWELWSARKREAERRRELETLAGMSAQQVREAVREVAAELAADHPPVRAKLEGYLMAVPAQIRRTLRRPSDHAGLTVPPDLVLARAEDLAPLLPPRPPRFTPGDKVAGTDFELIELLGIGGFGEVWKARNAFMPGAAAVALKFCLDPAAAASLRRETALLDRIQREGTHPGIVQLRHTFLSSDPPFLEYELVEGGDLGGLILDWHRQKGGPSAVAAARVVRRLAEVIAFAHARGIVHRDLKPANILLGKDEGGRMKDEAEPRPSSSLILPPSSLRLKVADFGIGGIAAEAAARQALLTRASGTLTAAAAHGSYSLYYASPEQMRGAPADPRDDVHALGVIWYQLLVGDLTAEAPRGAGWKKRLAAKGMTAELTDLLEACVATDRPDRPADGRELADRLGFVLAEPAPGIDLPLGPEKLPDLEFVGTAGRPPASPIPPAPPPDLGIPRSAIETELRRSRSVDFVARLRDLKSRHDRLRWAAGGWARTFQLLLVVGAAVGAGAVTHAQLDDYSGARANTIGQQVAAYHSTETIPVQWTRIYYGGGRFSLRYPQSRSYGSQNPTDPRAYTTEGSAPSPAGREAVFTPVVGYDTPPKEFKEKVDKYIHEVNQKLAEAAAEYNREREERNLWLWVGIVGVSTLLVAGPLFLLVRRAVRRALESSTRELEGATAAEFAGELRGLPEPLDLARPTAVARMITALEAAGSIPRPLPNPFWPVRRVLAPF